LLCVLSDLKIPVFVCFDDNGWIVDHHCLSFLS
jgi:hypothetical protein